MLFLFNPSTTPSLASGARGGPLPVGKLPVEASSSLLEVSPERVKDEPLPILRGESLTGRSPSARLSPFAAWLPAAPQVRGDSRAKGVRFAMSVSRTNIYTTPGVPFGAHFPFAPAHWPIDPTARELWRD